MSEKKENKTKQIQTRFTEAEVELLKAKAKEEGRTVSNLIHTIVITNLNN